VPKRDLESTDPALGSIDPALHPPIPFADADWAWFEGRCTALRIGAVAALRPQLETLYGHLVGVNRWLNLTKLTSPREYLKLHVLDSLSAETDTRLRHLSEGAPCVDLGSGGGYPGLPLALRHPNVPWVLVDSRQKKVQFLEAACRLAESFGVNRISARHLRGGEAAIKAADLRRRCQLVVCRAMGTATEILRESAELLETSGHALIYKGQAYAQQEKAEALKVCAGLGFRFVSQHDVVLEDGDPARVLVVFQRVK
jgi:16S rRNA (guanine527-N7)-methyltransferase